MSSIAKCRYDIQKYNNLKENIRSILPYLNSAMGSMDDTNNTLNGKYLINDEDTPILKRISIVKNDVKKTYEMLNKTIMPAIDRAIDDLNNQIAQLEADQASGLY